jgi:hypothetical protein
LPQDFAETVGVKRRLVALRVRKPERQEYIRVHPGETFSFQTAVLTIKGERDGAYLLAPELWDAFAAEITPTLLVLAVTRQANPFLWPLRLPRQDGRQDIWGQSALEAAQIGKDRWVRVCANMEMGLYDVHQAPGDLGEPQWPELTMEEALKLAFKDRFISDPGHPVLRRLQGEI